MSIEKRFSDKSARIGVIGLGYVGLPLAVEFARAGFKVTGIDTDRNKVEKLQRGENYIQDVDGDELTALVSGDSLTATATYEVISELDAVFIAVPTPLNKVQDPDVSYIIDVLDQLSRRIRKGQLIVLESTTYPGTTRELVLPKLEESGLKAGQDFHLCFSPERIDPGNQTYQLKNTPKVIGGITSTCTRLGQALYAQIVDEVVPVSSPESAEMVKLLENTFRSINIGLVNEVAIMCEKLGVDAWEVMKAAATKPFGFMKFTPGPGLGGHCIPVDPHYLAWKMKTLDYRARFIELAAEINTHMPYHVVDLVAGGLNRSQKALNGSEILILGMSYKKDVEDIRESPALDVMKLLEESGARVDYFDPYVPVMEWNGAEKRGLAEIAPAVLRKYDAVVILTDHSQVDYELVRKESRLVIDTRNVYPLNSDANVIQLGVGVQG